MTSPRIDSDDIDLESKSHTVRHVYLLTD